MQARKERGLLAQAIPKDIPKIIENISNAILKCKKAANDEFILNQNQSKPMIDQVPQDSVSKSIKIKCNEKTSAIKGGLIRNISYLEELKELFDILKCAIVLSYQLYPNSKIDLNTFNCLCSAYLWNPLSDNELSLFYDFLYDILITKAGHEMIASRKLDALLFDCFMKINIDDITEKGLLCFMEIIVIINLILKTMELKSVSEPKSKDEHSRSSFQYYTVMNDTAIGIEFLYNIFINHPNQKVCTAASQELLKLYTRMDSNFLIINKAGVFNKILENCIMGINNAINTSNQWRIEIILKFLNQFIWEMEGLNLNADLNRALGNESDVTLIIEFKGVEKILNVKSSKTLQELDKDIREKAFENFYYSKLHIFCRGRHFCTYENKSLFSIPTEKKSNEKLLRTLYDEGIHQGIAVITLIVMFNIFIYLFLVE